MRVFDRYDRPIEEQYFDLNGEPTIGPEGSFMIQREYTSRGQVSRVRYLDASGQHASIDGVYGISVSYNAYGNKEYETWLDINGQPALNQDGYASVYYDYDLSDSSRVEKYFQYYLDTERKPIQAKNGAWGITVLYYPVTRIHEVTYIDQNGRPVMISDGYAILQYEEDEAGNRTWEGYLDAIYAQVNCSKGYASLEIGYDGQGRKISERYKDRYDKLTNNKDGVAGWNGYYDNAGQLVITNCYDQDRMKVAVPDGLGQ